MPLNGIIKIILNPLLNTTPGIQPVRSKILIPESKKREQISFKILRAKTVLNHSKKILIKTAPARVSTNPLNQKPHFSPTECVGVV